MNENDIGFERFEEELHAENTFICGSSATLRTEAAAELSKLSADGKTVLVTDPYLFPNSPDGAYSADLEALLKGLGAAKIVYCAKTTRNDAFYRRMQAALGAAGTVLDFTNRLSDCHDRFWYCPETEKCLVFGTSLNGIGRKICRIDMLTPEETAELKRYFVRAGIINGT